MAKEERGDPASLVQLNEQSGKPMAGYCLNRSRRDGRAVGGQHSRFYLCKEKL